MHAVVGDPSLDDLYSLGSLSYLSPPLYDLSDLQEEVALER
jgi:hypothetical protein